jgi:hypothetical protein
MNECINQAPEILKAIESLRTLSYVYFMLLLLTIHICTYKKD